MFHTFKWNKKLPISAEGFCNIWSALNRYSTVQCKAYIKYCRSKVSMLLLLQYFIFHIKGLCKKNMLKADKIYTVCPRSSVNQVHFKVNAKLFYILQKATFLCYFVIKSKQIILILILCLG